MRGFTPKELSALRLADAELDALPVTLDEYRAAKELDRVAMLQTMEPKVRRVCERKSKNYATNKNGCADRQREYSRKYKAEHSEQCAATTADWRSRNADAVREYNAAWRASNKEAISEYNREYGRKRRAEMTPEQRAEENRRRRERYAERRGKREEGKKI